MAKFQTYHQCEICRRVRATKKIGSKFACQSCWAEHKKHKKDKKKE